MSDVNYNWSDNHNDSIAFRPVEAFRYLTILIQPPSILPISISWEVRSWYLLLLRFFVSQAIPLGNLTSQVFANIYMNELDQFIKNELKIKYYIRYADDFIFLSENRKFSEGFIAKIKTFLNDRLKLCLHLDKIVLRQLNWGIDFLGYIILPHYRLAKTKRRIFKKLKEKIYSENFNQSFQSYLGYLSHANSYEVGQELKNQALFMLH